MKIPKTSRRRGVHTWHYVPKTERKRGVIFAAIFALAHRKHRFVVRDLVPPLTKIQAESNLGWLVRVGRLHREHGTFGRYAKPAYYSLP